MPLTTEINYLNDFYFQKPIRAIFSGSSQSGKTYLIGKILEQQENLFNDKFNFVKYYYPTYLDESPVDYHNLTDTPISYNAGFPTKEDILSLEQNSLVIIDDQADTAVKSDLINQVYKVISGKKNISIILVTQNYFLQGKHSRDIRNSCNYIGLFRNCCDHTLNKRVATAVGLKRAYEAAEKDDYCSKVYPYAFINQCQAAQLSSYRLYTDILGDYKVAYSATGMKGYILSEDDFLSTFKIVSSNKQSVVAVKKHAIKKTAISESSESSEKSSDKRKKKRRREKRQHCDLE